MTFPSTALRDNFNRADEGPPPSASWIAKGVNPGLKVLSNEAIGNTTGVNSALWDLTFGPDSEAHVDIPAYTTVNDDYILLYARLVDVAGAADGYGVASALSGGTNFIYALRIDNDVNTILGALVAVVVAAGDSLGIEVIGSTIKGFHRPSGGSWAEVLSRTDATYAGAGRVGLEMNRNVIRADNFGGGLAAPHPPWPARFQHY